MGAICPSTTNEHDLVTHAGDEPKTLYDSMDQPPPDLMQHTNEEATNLALVLSGHGSHNLLFHPKSQIQKFRAGDETEWVLNFSTSHLAWFSIAQMLNGISQQPGYGWLDTPGVVLGWTYYTIGQASELNNLECFDAPPDVEREPVGRAWEVGSIVLRGHGIDGALYPSRAPQPITAPDGTFWYFHWVSSKWFAIQQVIHDVPQRAAYGYMSGQPGQTGRVGSWTFETNPPNDAQDDSLVPLDLIFCHAPAWLVGDDYKGDVPDDTEEPSLLELKGHGCTIAVKPDKFPQYHRAPDGTQWLVKLSPDRVWCSVQRIVGDYPRFAKYLRLDEDGTLQLDGFTGGLKICSRDSLCDGSGDNTTVTLNFTGHGLDNEPIKSNSMYAGYLGAGQYSFQDGDHNTWWINWPECSTPWFSLSKTYFPNEAKYGWPGYHSNGTIHGFTWVKTES